MADGVVDKRKISLEDLWHRLYDGRMLILACGVLGFLFALLFLWDTPKAYTVKMLVAPPLENMSQRDAAEGGALAAIGLGGLTNQVSPEPFHRYEGLLNSQVVADRLQQDHHILQLLFSNRWDAETQRWKPKGGISASIKSMLGMSQPDPGVSDILGFIGSNVSVSSPSLTSPIREISLRYNDPQDAARILSWLHRETDNAVRNSTMQRTHGMIQYLKQQLPVVDNDDERLALSKLLVEREQDLMLMVVGLDYAAVIIDAPDPSNASIYPSVKLTIIFSTLLGSGLGAILCLVGLSPLRLSRWLKGIFFRRARNESELGRGVAADR